MRRGLRERPRDEPPLVLEEVVVGDVEDPPEVRLRERRNPPRELVLAVAAQDLREPSLDVTTGTPRTSTPKAAPSGGLLIKLRGWDSNPQPFG